MVSHAIYLGFTPCLPVTDITLVLVIIGVLSKLLQNYVNDVCSPSIYTQWPD